MIYYIIGIRRSGLHAIANWLFPMMGEYIYLNNYELGKLQENELVINGKFNVIIGLENKPVDEVLKYTNNGKRIWIWRDPDEIMRSQRKWYNENCDDDDVRKKLAYSASLVRQYHVFISGTIEQTVMYDMWNTDEVYRRYIAGELNLQFNDSNKEKIFGYGKSSFV